jgi:hypothetical protein
VHGIGSDALGTGATARCLVQIHVHQSAIAQHHAAAAPVFEAHFTCSSSKTLFASPR